MGMFTNFSKTTHPDNRFEFLPKEKVDEIIIGASCKHVFKIPFAYSSIVESGVVIYSQGVNTSFAIKITEDMIKEKKGYDESVIVVKLPVIKTLLFSEDKAGNSTKCQLKLLLKTGETYYDKPYKLKVFKPLEILTTSDSATSIDKAQDAVDAYTKAEADALISLYEAKIAELEERIRALEEK